MQVLVVATSGTGGILPPIISHIKQQYGTPEVLLQWLPWHYRLLLALKSFSPQRDRWRRNWLHQCEKTSFAFKTRTRLMNNIIKRNTSTHASPPSFALIFGALHDIDLPNETKRFMVTDSTRCLSMRNKHDEQSHFRNTSDQQEWITLETKMYQKANLIFVGNKRIKESLINDYGVAENRVIITGFGAGLGAAPRLDKQFDGKTLLYIGKGDFEKKGGLVLLEAFRLLKQHIPQAVLHIVGQDQDKVPKVDGVVNHGYITDRNRLKELMTNAHCFVLPSLVDRNPITVIEAMAASTPCIVSDYGAMPEMVEGVGIVTAQEDSAGLATVMEKLLRDPALSKKLGELGREKYERIYNWERIWGDMVSHIESAIHK